ncbi:MAG: MgtC/SapB family protein [Deltaproteobacteria bacterium]|jgi:putative Mg2+ transporter-C (MgtC) family protein|nr:MgtC/SapB family protein [Deltaproteobacteria bacterium]
MIAPGVGVLVTRIAVGAALGGVIGYERDRHRRPVGLRTHIIVALAAATFMVVSAWFPAWQGYEVGAGVDVDASRIAASVVSAIGFLAGGAILRNGLSIQGLTTAAGLWLVTAIGLAAGAGMFAVAAAVTAMGVLTLTLLRRFEDKADHLARHRVEATLRGAPAALFAGLTPMGATVEGLVYERRLFEGTHHVAFDLVVDAKVPFDTLVATLEATPDLVSVRLAPRG